MLECAQRLARDPRLRTDAAVLRTHYGALTAAVNAYRLCDPRTAWDVRQQAPRPSSPLKRKATADDDSAASGVGVSVVDLSQMQADAVMARGQLRLLDHGAKVSDVALLSAGDLVTLLCQHGLFSTAADVALACKVSLTVVVDSLARRCVQLQRDPTAPYAVAVCVPCPLSVSHAVLSLGRFVAEDEPCGVLGPAAAAWELLQRLLTDLDGAALNYDLHAAVARALLPLSEARLPPWFAESFKVLLLLVLYSFADHVCADP